MRAALTYHEPPEELCMLSSLDLTATFIINCIPLFTSLRCCSYESSPNMLSSMLIKNESSLTLVLSASFPAGFNKFQQQNMVDRCRLNVVSLSTHNPPIKRINLNENSRH